MVVLLQVLQAVSDGDVACFAFELEQDIAALEAEAKRWADHLFCLHCHSGLATVAKRCPLCCREDESFWDCSVTDDTLGSGPHDGDQAAGDDMDHFSPHQTTGGCTFGLSCVGSMTAAKHPYSICTRTSVVQHMFQ